MRKFDLFEKRIYRNVEKIPAIHKIIGNFYLKKYRQLKKNLQRKISSFEENIKKISWSDKFI